MPYWLDFNTNVIQIMGGHFYIYKSHLMWEHDYKWSLWCLRPMVILTKCVISIFFSAIALAFGIHDKTNIKNQFLGEIYKF